jgi:hypothetical protein
MDCPFRSGLRGGNRGASGGKATPADGGAQTCGGQTRRCAVAAPFGGEHSFAREASFRYLARAYERLAATLPALHYLAFAIIMLANLAKTRNGSS